MAQEPQTVVIFRTWKKSGDVIAIFPELPASQDGRDCMSYMHVGQHGGCQSGYLTTITRPSTDEEIKKTGR